MNILPMGTQSKCMFSLLLRSNYRKTCVTQLLLISILHPLGWMDMADYPSLSCSLITKIKDSVAIPNERLLNFPMLVESQLAIVTVTVVELFPSPPPFELVSFACTAYESINLLIDWCVNFHSTSCSLSRKTGHENSENYWLNKIVLMKKFSSFLKKCVSLSYLGN